MVKDRTETRKKAFNLDEADSESAVLDNPRGDSPMLLWRLFRDTYHGQIRRYCLAFFPWR